MVIDRKEILVHGYDPETSTVYQFYGCKWHSCPCLGSSSDKYQKTLSMENRIHSLVHNTISVWEHENQELSYMYLRKEFMPYLYLIMYDFEDVLSPVQYAPIEHLTLASTHIPVSVVINDNHTSEAVFTEHSDRPTDRPTYPYLYVSL